MGTVGSGLRGVIPKARVFTSELRDLAGSLQRLISRTPDPSLRLKSGSAQDDAV
jgi:hypothetical protein